MKLIVVAFVALVVVAVSAVPQYTTKYDNVNLDEILRSERLLKNYINCLMERGKCSPDGKELKEVLPDAIETECSKCNERQKSGTEKIIRFLVNNKPETWNELADKYDPEKKFRTKWEDKAKELGINV
ncbi:ejaculatory bulb-specific protein 3-like [Venturia canescens]|uniref:ejaculatory bulb-specific protein 3-like n=1 Tax=Venturia canescens TaxID=32260 RepID=UPI001C9C91C2|nr:ejaculatory bulb-specific protein 3-like [Venturia canescens]